MTIGQLERIDTHTTGELKLAEVQAAIDQLDGAASSGAFVAVDPHASERCGVNGCRQIHVGALIVPTIDEGSGDGDVLIELVRGVDGKAGWPVWRGDVHHAEQRWTETVADLRSWADNFDAVLTTDPIVVEPVQVDYSYRDTEAWQYASIAAGALGSAGVYAELAPERLATNNSAPPDDRLDRMVEDPERYFAEARERAAVDREALDNLVRRVNGGLRRLSTDIERSTEVPGEHPTKPEPPEPDGWVRTTWWRRALAWIAGRRR